MTYPRAALAIAVLVVSLAPASRAGADANAGGEIGGHGDPHLRVSLQVITEGSNGTVAYGPHDRAAPSPIRIQAVAGHSPGNGFDNVCNAGNAPAQQGQPIAWGWWYTVTTIDNATGNVLSVEPVCVPLPPLTTPGSNPPPFVVASPPTIAEVWGAAGIPAPDIGVSPAGEGVVGLDTWLWSGGATQVQVAVSVRGYTVTGTAHIVEYRFDPGDGALTSAPSAGSEHAPAATHTYDRKALYSLRIASVWEGEFTLTGPGITTPLPVQLGRAVVTAARDYRVVEVRSVLVP